MSEPKTKLPDARAYPRFAGVCTFYRYPRVCDVIAGGGGVDWAVYGAPFDAGVTYRPGARFGPRAVREASQYIKVYSVEHDVTVTEALSLADGGDAPVQPYSCEGTHELVTEFAMGLGDQGRTRLLMFGGDHSNALANIRASWERAGKPSGGLAMVHFDAHLDTVDALWGEKFGHASPFIRAIEAGYVDPARMISVGVRGPLNSKGDLEYAAKHGVRIVSPERLRDEGVGLLSSFVKELGGAPAYLSFDIDCFDPSAAPGTGTPAVGGLTVAEGLASLRALAGVELLGADVVEVLPDRDPAGVTALLAAQVGFEALALGALRV